MRCSAALPGGALRCCGLEKWQMLIYGVLLIVFIRCCPSGLASLPERLAPLIGEAVDEPGLARVRDLSVYFCGPLQSTGRLRSSRASCAV